MGSLQKYELLSVSENIGVSNSYKLKCFVDYTIKYLKKYGITDTGKFRLRGDILEVSVCADETIKNDSATEFKNYVTLGIFISFLKKLISQYGLKAGVRMFPKFDEPHLIAFIHITGTSFRPIHLNVTVGTDYNAYKSLLIEQIKKIANTRNLMISISGSSKKWYNSRLDKYYDSNYFSDSVFLNSPIEVNIGHTHSMPTIWLQVGDFIGEVLFEAVKMNIEESLVVSVQSKKMKKPVTENQLPASLNEYATLRLFEPLQSV
jgi:hypothetical protein